MTKYSSKHTEEEIKQMKQARSKRWYAKMKAEKPEKYQQMLQRKYDQYHSDPELRARKKERNDRERKRNHGNPDWEAKRREYAKNWSFKRSACYGCENYKWIDHPHGETTGGFHYCKKYPQAGSNYYKRLELCFKLYNLKKDNKDVKRYFQNKHTLPLGTDERCCGCCQYFSYEDTDGFGYCDKSTNRPEAHCSDVCLGFEHE